jgi:hypothetical protein
MIQKLDLTSGKNYKFDLDIIIDGKDFAKSPKNKSISN